SQRDAVAAIGRNQCRDRCGRAVDDVVEVADRDICQQQPFFQRLKSQPAMQWSGTARPLQLTRRRPRLMARSTRHVQSLHGDDRKSRPSTSPTPSSRQEKPGQIVAVSLRFRYETATPSDYTSTSYTIATLVQTSCVVLAGFRISFRS